jgi:hypothetical protein
MGRQPEPWDPTQPAHHTGSRAESELEAVSLVAHYLIDSVAVIVATAARLRAEDESLDEAQRQHDLARLELHGVHVAEVLAALARGEAVDALTALAAATDEEPALLVPLLGLDGDSTPTTSWVDRLGLAVPSDLRPPDPPVA